MRGSESTIGHPLYGMCRGSLQGGILYHVNLTNTIDFPLLQTFDAEKLILDHIFHKNYQLIGKTEIEVPFCLTFTILQIMTVP